MTSEEEKKLARRVSIATVEMLMGELRAYREAYPDADWNDMIGYLAGVKGRLEHEPVRK